MSRARLASAYFCLLLSASLTHSFLIAFSPRAAAAPTQTNAPPNDNFADAQEITGCSGSVTGNNQGATAEQGEPDHSQNGDLPGHTVWYEFTAFNNAELTLDTAGSDFDTLLTVYTGDRFDNLQFLVGNTNVPEGGTHSRVRFKPPHRPDLPHRRGRRAGRLRQTHTQLAGERLHDGRADAHAFARHPLLRARA